MKLIVKLVLVLGYVCSLVAMEDVGMACNKELYDTVVSGDVVQVQRLLTQRAAGSSEALRLADEKSDPAIDLLLESSGDFNMALCAAVYSGRVAIVNLVLETWRRRLSDYYIDWALSHAAEKGHLGIVRLLIAKGGAVHFNEAVCKAAFKGHIEIVRLFLETGRERLTVDDFDKAAHAANAGGRPKIVKLLLERATDFNWALRCAAFYGHGDIVKLMLVRGVTDVAVGNALWHAVRGGHIDIVKVLLARRGTTDFYFASVQAAKYGHIDIVRFLIEQAAYFNPTPLRYNRLMITAAEEGHIDIVRLLIEKGSTDFGRLMRECCFGSSCARAIANLCLLPGFAEFRADPLAFIEQHDEVSPEILVFWAVIMHNAVILDYLLDEAAARSTEDKIRLANASYEIGRDWDVKVVTLAAACGLNDMVYQLVRAGADINARNFMGWTAIDSAPIYGNYLILAQRLYAQAAKAAHEEKNVSLGFPNVIASFMKE